ncbi:MAG: hypothetical protein Kow0037_13440 [Calditrichia bacterium]
MQIKWLGLLLLLCSVVAAQQLSISRVDLMPDYPQPYLMRDWKKTALTFDSIAFNQTLTGQYLPLIFWRTNNVNYPNHLSFGIHSYVGTANPAAGEAITVLPAVIGASLLGVDKSNQNGINYVLMCEEYFNRRPEENVYLNGPVTSSGNDWWYDTMPNVFFYQLYSMYPGTGDFDYQFTTVADRWLEAVRQMGGSTTPWQKPYMNYRGWHLASMTPNTAGVPEPEAAGAIGWLLYQAYNQTGREDYRIGAEWCLEFLDSWISNPAYELQLPYGVYAAARMNAELHTAYNLQRLLNWCFDVGSLRDWGVIVGNWGGYDVHGLVGEALGPGYYAFFMNGAEQLGALLPVARYDDRFAAALGKWALHVANASRLFYSNFLPDSLQDNESWTHQYDPRSGISYEALKRNWNGLSPYATGDAMANGWAATNLGLYGAAHVGILGAVVDTTDVPMILRLNLLATDYFHPPAYPSYLYYNPYPVAKTVTVPLGNSPVDIYDAVNNAFLAQAVQGSAAVEIPAGEARLLVLAPAGGVQTYQLDRLLIDGVVVDYSSGQPVNNYPPRFKALAAEAQPVTVLQNVNLYATAADPDMDSLTYQWLPEAGQISGNGATVQWQAPAQPGVYRIICRVIDPQQAAAEDTLFIEVVQSINHPPEINSIWGSPRKIDLGENVQLHCSARDPDGDSLLFTWQAAAGSIQAQDSQAVWTAPAVAGDYFVACLVSDSAGATARDSLLIRVRDFSAHQTGHLIAWYPFNGNANDASGNGHHGTVFGAAQTEDREGNANSAYWFDGVNDLIRVTNHSQLNFQNGISVVFWMRNDFAFNREAFPLSHGSWENRWKVSLIADQRLRWTINTADGIVDGDTPSPLNTGEWYHVAVVYDGADFEIWLNGEAVYLGSWSGLLNTTTYDFTMGQRLPGDPQYNFRGALDEVRLFDYGLSPSEIRDLYTTNTGLEGPPAQLPGKFRLEVNYPNPFNPETLIGFYLPVGSRVQLSVYNLLGQKVAELLDKQLPAGHHTIPFRANGQASGIYFYEVKANGRRLVGKMILSR